MDNRFVDDDLDWLVEEEPTKQKGHFIQDPVTGLLQGSEPGPGIGEGDGGGKEGAAPLHPEAVNVGGDEWNKQTAVRLEKEFAEAAPKLEKIVDDAVSEKVEVEADEEAPDPDNAPYVPEDWSMMSQEQQDDAETQYKDKTHSDYYDSEVTNWQENSAADDAGVEVSYKFEKGEQQWAYDAINEYQNTREGDGNPPVPFSTKQLVDALKVDYSNTGYNDLAKGVSIEFDDSKLTDAINFDPAQQTLPGIEPKTPADMLTPGMRDDLISELEDAFVKEGENVQQKMDPPDYLEESISEFQSDSWGQMDDKDKFSWVTGNTNIVEDAQKEYDDYFGENKPGGETGSIDKEPNKYDPLQQNASAADYARTRNIARHLSIERAANIMVQRGLYKDTGQLTALENARADAKRMDRNLWEGWKGSSHGTEGQILQKAVADELGGRLNPKMVDQTQLQRENHADYLAPNAAKGKAYDAVKAYVRGKWETTQYMLAKAGINTVNLYRAVNIPDTEPPGVFQNGTGPGWSVSTIKTFEKETDAFAFINSQKQINPNGSFSITNPHADTNRVKAIYRFDDEKQAREFADKYQKNTNDPLQHSEEVKTPDTTKPGTTEGRVGGVFTRLPDIHVVRNGAASMTTDRRVANGWSSNNGRVVLRASVPRTAVISVPAYGQNIQGEHEVVVAGTAWKGWDSWRGQAPAFDQIKIGHQVAA
jgi:hypothetical protein